MDFARFDSTGSKMIRKQNNLYSLASKLSQISRLFNHFVWEPLNSEGFKKLTYNAKDQKNSELLVPSLKRIPKDTPFIATHVWPAQGAVHAAEFGDGTFECAEKKSINRMIDRVLEDKEFFVHMVEQISKLKTEGYYDGAYQCVKLAVGKNIDL